MIQQRKIYDRITALFLLVLMLFPIVSEATHALGDHEHPICTDVTTHLHELEPDCSICDFHLTVFTFNVLEESITINEVSYLPIASHYTPSTSLENSHHYLLRGPPQIQQYS